MSFETYRLLHIAGMLLVFFGLGGIILQAEPGRGSRIGLILHGSGMILVLFAGFGALAVRNYAFPWPLWIWGKFIVWLILGAYPSLHKRGVVPTNLSWLIVLAIGASAIALAIHRPGS